MSVYGGSLKMILRRSQLERGQMEVAAVFFLTGLIERAVALR